MNDSVSFQLPNYSIFLAIGFLAILIFLIIRFFNSKYYGYDENDVEIHDLDKSEELVEKKIIKALEVYHKMAATLHKTYVIMGGLAILSSVFVTTFIASKETDGIYKDVLPYVAFISTACLTLITAFNLGTKANNCRSAWRLLDYAYGRYKVKKIEIDELLKVKDEAEKIVGGVDFQYKP